MLIRPFDDLHCEFNQYKFHPLPKDSETVCVLAGDIGVGSQLETWVPLVQAASKRFAHVVYVLGNHEYYDGVIPNTCDFMKAKVSEFKNVHIVENEIVEIDDVTFIGATLWTDFNSGNPIDMHMANHGLSDYRAIKVQRIGEHIIKGEPYIRRLIPSDILVLHNQSKAFLMKTTVEKKADGKKVVLVVHHGVTNRSINPYYENDPLNPAFCSELTEELLEIQPDLVIHGHVHYAQDYYVDEDNKKIRVVCNPRGYFGYENNTGFNPTKLIEL